MDNGEGDNKTFFDSIRSRYSHQFWSILSYIVLFGILLAIFWFFNCSLNNDDLDPDNVRYILSALIQSQAAIVTLTVSISLIAAQFMSSSYSIRIIEIFRDIRKNPDLWIILGIYLAVIIFDIYVLVFFNFVPDNVLNDDNLLFGFSSAECVGLSIFLGTFAILSLIPYIFNTLSILRLNTIIKILGEDIKSLELDRHKNQSLQIFHDLLISGISRYDISLVYSVMDELSLVFRRISNSIYRSEKNEKEIRDAVDQITWNYCEFINRVQDYAFDNKMESAVVALIISINNIIVIISPQDYVKESVIFRFISPINSIVKKSVNIGFNSVLLRYNYILNKQLKLFNSPQRLKSLKSCIYASSEIYSEYQPENHLDHELSSLISVYDYIIEIFLNEGNFEIIERDILPAFFRITRAYMIKGFVLPVRTELIPFYNSILEKCVTDRYNPIIRSVISTYLKLGFLWNSGNHNIKEAFIEKLNEVKETHTELFNEELNKFKELLGGYKPGILADVREIFPED